jgi:hypothetical protein
MQPEHQGGFMKPMLAVLFLLAGCAAEDTITVTAIKLNPDGSRTVTETELTLEEQQELNAERATFVAAGGAPTKLGVYLQVTGCYGDALWLYDGPSFTGNMFCLDGAGAAPLSDFERVTCSGPPWDPYRTCVWVGMQPWQARSLWAGRRQGWIFQQWSFSQWFTFSPWQQMPDLWDASNAPMELRPWMMLQLF